MVLSILLPFPGQPIGTSFFVFLSASTDLIGSPTVSVTHGLASLFTSGPSASGSNGTGPQTWFEDGWQWFANPPDVVCAGDTLVVTVADSGNLFDSANVNVTWDPTLGGAGHDPMLDTILAAVQADYVNSP